MVGVPVPGVLWFLFSVPVFRFDYMTLILFGIVAIAAGVNELFTIGVAAGWRKSLHVFPVAVFVIGGIGDGGHDSGIVG